MTSPGIRFKGRSARAERPSLVRVASFAMLLIGLGGTAGCIGGGEPLPMLAPQTPIAVDADRLEDLSEALAEAETDEEREAVLAAALRSAGVAPVADGRVPGGVQQYRVGSVLAGWIVGRHPVQRDSLVVAQAPRDGRSDLALIEAARLLVARSAYTQTPERSVLIVIGEDATSALRLWDRQLVVGSVQVSEGSLKGANGRSIQVAPGDPNDLAPRLFRAMVTAADPPNSIYTPTADLAE